MNESNNLESDLQILVLANEVQSPAAKPGFHSDPPNGGGTGLEPNRRFFNHGCGALDEQPKNRDMGFCWGSWLATLVRRPPAKSTEKGSGSVQPSLGHEDLVSNGLEVFSDFFSSETRRR